MKKMLCFLLFVMSFVSFSQDLEELPRALWEDIIEIKESSTNKELRRWKDEVKIGLQGDYTEQDSMKIAEFVKQLDIITETISIKLTNLESSNLYIIFSLINGENNLGFSYRYHEEKQNSKLNGYILNGEIYVKRNVDLDKKTMSHLKITLSRVLFDGNYMIPRENTGYSLFENSPNYTKEKKEWHLTDRDLLIVEEIYKEGFEERLNQAEKLYKEKVLSKIHDYRIESRYSDLWWVKNPIAVLLLPALGLLVIVLLVITRLRRMIYSKVKSKLLAFTITAFIALFLLDLIIILWVSCYDFMTIQEGYNISFIREDTWLTTFYVSIFFFPTIYLFRFLEFKIQKTVKSIYSKTALIFLSTGLLPLFIYLSIVVILIFIEGPKDLFKKPQNIYLQVSYVFVFLMCLASLRALISFFIFKERELVIEQEIQISHLQELKAKAELKSLQSQINPHFLYNSLNSIASLAPVDAFKTQKMTYSLSDLFKYSINRKGKKMSTIQDEIIMVNAYLEIEKIRFGDRLKFDIEVEELVLNNEIPLFLIQPLVENAIKHGISKNKEKGVVTLKIELKDNQLYISVFDNGAHFPKGLVSGHGLQTVYDLLRLSYQDQATLNWTNQPEKMIQIIIPQNL